MLLNWKQVKNQVSKVSKILIIMQYLQRRDKKMKNKKVNRKPNPKNQL